MTEIETKTEIKTKTETETETKNMLCCDRTLLSSFSLFVKKDSLDTDTIYRRIFTLLANYEEKIAYTFEPEISKYTVSFREIEYYCGFAIQVYDCGTEYAISMKETSGESLIRHRFLKTLARAVTTGVIAIDPPFEDFPVSLPPMTVENFAKHISFTFTVLDSVYQRTMEEVFQSVYKLLLHSYTQEAAMSYPELVKRILLKLDPSQKQRMSDRTYIVNILHAFAKHPTGKLTLASQLAECTEFEKWILNYLTVPYPVHRNAMNQLPNPSRIQTDTTLLYRALLDFLKEAGITAIRPEYLESFKAAITGFTSHSDQYSSLKALECLSVLTE